MQVTVEEIGPCKKRLRVEVPKEDVKQRLDESYRELKSLPMPGFRPGKVPRKLLERRFGAKVEEEVSSKLRGESFADAVKQHSLRPLGEPSFEKLEFDAKEGMSYEVTLAVMPDFELPDLSELKALKPGQEVSEEELDAALEKLCQQHASLEPIEGDPAVEPEYFVECDVTVKGEDGEVIAEKEGVGLIPERDNVLGLDIENLGEKLSGAEIGDVRTLDVELPHEHSHDHHDHDHEECDEDHSHEHDHDHTHPGTLILSIKEIKRVNVPEPTEEWADEMGYDDLTELKEEMKSHLLAEKDQKVNQKIEDQLIEQLLEELDFEVPEDFLENLQRDMAMRTLMQEMAQKQQHEQSEEDFKARFDNLVEEGRDEALRRLKTDFILDKIADNEGISVSEDEINAFVERMAYQEGRWPNEVMDELQSKEKLGEVESAIRFSKARVALREKAQVIEEENK